MRIPSSACHVSVSAKMDNYRKTYSSPKAPVNTSFQVYGITICMGRLTIPRSFRKRLCDPCQPQRVIPADGAPPFAPASVADNSISTVASFKWPRPWLCAVVLKQKAGRQSLEGKAWQIVTPVACVSSFNGKTFMVNPSAARYRHSVQLRSTGQPCLHFQPHSSCLPYSSHAESDERNRGAYEKTYCWCFDRIWRFECDGWSRRRGHRQGKA